ncbi:type II toxin-antitoxin system RelE/ParE family toxin [Cedecea sp.]|uniref:type II toxin-antitoxin system RelE/ParE family toxin n=1 Tax=Cedecea sp. TaxID=1970739 RepID=UPI002F3E421E
MCYRFSKALARLYEQSLKVVEVEIEWVITSPEMGEFKRGDLNYPRGHKFHLNNRLVLLGYCLG